MKGTFSKLTLFFLISFPLAFQPQTSAELQTAVDLWVSDNASALASYGEINTWDVSLITNMSNLFNSKTTFNDDISAWDVSNVTNMSQMFQGASAFNQDISSWDVSNVTNMVRVFTDATVFNQDIGSWNVSSATNMNHMFYRARAFNKDISGWDVSNVTDMHWMFVVTDDFNQDISAWDVSNVVNMQRMFHYAYSFNQDISGWDVSSVTDMEGMFLYADDLSDENKCAIHTSFSSNPNWNYDWSSLCSVIFQPQTTAELQTAVDLWVSDNATALSTYGEINTWDVSLITDMSGLFKDTSFNDDISNWNVSNVATMFEMFRYNSSFNQDISSWDVSSVTSMQKMFRAAGSFTSDLSGWDVSSVTDMTAMFQSAGSFTSDLSGWNVANVTGMEYMFFGAVNFNGDLSSWDVSSVSDMQYMFMDAEIFNQDLSDWDVSSVTTMYRIFTGASAFDQDISNWDVSSVTTMNEMFNGASSFNQDLSSWNVSNVTAMHSMFYYATSFNGDISGWNVSSVTNMTNMFEGAAALSDENKCAIHTAFSSNTNWPYDWSSFCSTTGAEISVSPSELYEELFEGDTETQTLTITNDGGDDLIWELSINTNRSFGIRNTSNSPLNMLTDELRYDHYNSIDINSNYVQDPNDLYSGDRNNIEIEINRDSEEEIFGNTNNSSTGSQVMKGNIFYVDNSTILLEQKVYLSIDSPTELYFMVYEGDNHPGSYTKISEIIIEESGTGEGWYSSGNIEVPLNSEKYYYIVADWSSDATYYWSSNEPMPISTSFGSLLTREGMMDWPPPAELNLDAENLTPYFQSIVTGSSMENSYLSTSTTSGTVSSGLSEDIQVTFDAEDLTSGEYTADIVITSNDSVNPVINVPVTLNVISNMAAEISVSPSELNEQLVEGDSSSQVLTISNSGDIDLAWEISNQGGGGSDSSSISTLFTGGNAHQGNMFDITPLTDINIQKFDVHPDEGAINMEVFYKTGSYLGYESDLSAWTSVGTADIVGVGYGNPVELPVGDFNLYAGETYGIYITITGALGTLLNYTNGANTYSNGDLELSLGCGGEYGDCSYTPRTWNGTVYYSTSLNNTVSWLSTSETSGIIPAEESADITVNFNASEVTSGSYSSSLSITSNDTVNPVIDVPVSLEVTPAYPDISVAPDSLSEALVEGETSTQTLTIYNDGGANLDWTISPEGSRVDRVTDAERDLLSSNFEINIDCNTFNPENVDLPIGTSCQDFNESVNHFRPNENITFSRDEIVLTGDEDGFVVGSEYTSHPITTSLGMVYFTGLIQHPDNGFSDVSYTASGATGNHFNSNGNSHGFFHFNFDVNSITFAYGGNTGTILVTARDVNGNPIAEFYDEDTNSGEDGPATIVGNGIRSIEFQDTGAGTWSSIDNVALNGSMLQNWYSTDLNSGTILPGSSQDVVVSFDATYMEFGEYAADLSIESNDPDEPNVNVPVSLEVIPAPPVIAAIEDTSMDEDSELSLQLSAESAQGYQIFFEAESDTPSVYVYVVDDSLHINLESDWNGSSEITVLAYTEFSYESNDVTSFTLTVNSVDDLPYVDGHIYPRYYQEDFGVDTVAYLPDVFVDIDGDLTFSYLFTDGGVVAADVSSDHLVLSSLLNVSGTTQLLLTASNPMRASVTDTVDIEVWPVDDPPLVDIPDQLMMEDSEMFLNISGYMSDAESEELWVYVGYVSAPMNDYVDAHMHGSDTLHLIAHDNWNGGGDIEINVSDGGQETSDVFALEVRAVNDEPVFENLQALVPAGIQFHVPIHVYDIDMDSLVVTFDQSWEYPEWLSLDDNPYALTGTAPEPGSIHFPLQVTDAEVTITDTFHLTAQFFSPRITSVTDVPEDQGGRVYVSFLKSFFDLPDGTNQMYTVFRHDIVDNAPDWVVVGSGAAIGEGSYTYEVSTLMDSTAEGDAMTEFKVVASMDEGHFHSDPAMGYSTDDIAPGVPQGLMAVVVNEGIQLTWEMSADEDFQYFMLEKSSDEAFTEPEVFETIDIAYLDLDYVLNESNYYRIAAVDHAGNISDYSDVVDITVLAIDLDLIPEVFALHQNYPNPFNPTTRIKYDLPEDAMVSITIYDAMGRRVKSLVNTTQSAGYRSIQWNATNSLGEPVSAGMYIYMIQAGKFRQTKKMVLLK